MVFRQSVASIQTHFWPSPEKKPKKVVSRHKGELLPACASSQEWRDLYKQKELDKATSVSKSTNRPIRASTKRERSQ